ncbi:unnamed protein product [Adineta ricciae]|nr:unnamed protein product [Adineta ricciae]
MIVPILWRCSFSKESLCLSFLRISRRSVANASRASADHYLRQCYSVLEVDPSCRDETIIRKAYLAKVKQYHPDSPTHDSQLGHTKFNEVQQAYESLTESLKTGEIPVEPSEDDIHIKFDIRHTAPQHRTHLEYGGFGMGTPSQRQAAYYKMRAEKAHERVYEYRRDRESIETREELIERKKRKDVRATNFIERLVEDLIQESMSRGDFNNIRPSGKPLHERNPHYMDFTTYKINEILIDNGYMPEWILIEKQIRESIEAARINLKRVYKTIAIENCLSSDETRKTFLSNTSQWTQAVDKFRTDIVDINNNINKLNLIVPMLWRQQVHYNTDQEIEKILSLAPEKIELPPSEEELALIHREEMNQRHQEWTTHEASQKYSIGDAIKDFFNAFRNFQMDSLLMDNADSNGNGHHQNNLNNNNIKLSPNSFCDRDTLATLLLGNQSPTSAGALSSVDEWADSAGELLVELDNLSMLSQICDSVPRLPPKPNRSNDETRSSINSQHSKHLTFRDILAFWQCYDQLYIEQYQYDRRYSSAVIDQAVNAFGMQEYDLLSTTLSQSSSPPRGSSSYQRCNSQHEYEHLFNEFSSVANDESDDACLSSTTNYNKPSDVNNAAKLSILSKLLPMTTHSSPGSTDNDLNAFVADLDPRPTPNINDILANLKAGLIESNLNLTSFDESHLDLPRQRSSLTHNRLISSSMINNIAVPSVFINEVEHVRLVDLSKSLLNNLPLSTIKHYAKLLQCPIVMCPEFIRDFLMRNNRQASTSRSCFCTTLTDTKLIYTELIAANVPLPAIPKEEEALLLTKKRKHAPPKGWDDGSSDMIITVPQVKKHKPKLDYTTILLDHDYLSAEQMGNLWRRPSKKPLVTIPLPVSLPLPSVEPEDDLHFMECSPTPPVSAAPNTNQMSLLSSTSSSAPLVVPPPAPPPPPPPPPPILFKLRDYFHSHPPPTPLPTFYDAYSDERFLEITRHPLIIISQTQLDYLLNYLDKDIPSTSLSDRYHLY